MYTYYDSMIIIYQQWFLNPQQWQVHAKRLKDWPPSWNGKFRHSHFGNGFFSAHIVALSSMTRMTQQSSYNLCMDRISHFFKWCWSFLAWSWRLFWPGLETQNLETWFVLFWNPVAEHFLMLNIDSETHQDVFHHPICWFSNFGAARIHGSLNQASGIGGALPRGLNMEFSVGYFLFSHSNP